MVRNLSKTKQKMAVLVPDGKVIFLKLNILPENKWFTLNWSNFELIECRYGQNSNWSNFCNGTWVGLGLFGAMSFILSRELSLSCLRASLVFQGHFWSVSIRFVLLQSWISSKFDQVAAHQGIYLTNTSSKGTSTTTSTKWSTFQATRSQWDWPSGRICSFHSPRRVNNVALARHGVRGRGAADPTLGRSGAAAGTGRGRVREVEDGAGSGGRAAGGSLRFHLGDERGSFNETPRLKT